MKQCRLNWILYCKPDKKTWILVGELSDWILWPPGERAGEWAGMWTEDHQWASEGSAQVWAAYQRAHLPGTDLSLRSVLTHLASLNICSLKLESLDYRDWLMFFCDPKLMFRFTQHTTPHPHTPFSHNCMHLVPNCFIIVELLCCSTCSSLRAHKLVTKIFRWALMGLQPTV